MRAFAGSIWFVVLLLTHATYGQVTQEDASLSSRASSLEVTVPISPNSTCPIMGKAISSKLFVDTEMGRIYMCCKSCTKKILSDVPKAHQTAYPVTKKLDLAACPITGKPIGKESPLVVIQGYVIPVCSEVCVKEVQENAQVVLAKATNPKVSDLGNMTCPISNEPIAKNAFCLIGDTLVHLSSPTCLTEVKKDPAGTLEKAKSSMSAEKPR